VVSRVVLIPRGVEDGLVVLDGVAFGEESLRASSGS
jgi:hypothetical protein